MIVTGICIVVAGVLGWVNGRASARDNRQRCTAVDAHGVECIREAGHTKGVGAGVPHHFAFDPNEGRRKGRP